MSKRIVLEVRFSRSERLWYIRRRDISGGVLSYQRRKPEAVKQAAGEAKALDTAVSVVIYLKNGRIEEERTYPRSTDPIRRRG